MRFWANASAFLVVTTGKAGLHQGSRQCQVALVGVLADFQQTTFGRSQGERCIVANHLHVGIHLRVKILHGNYLLDQSHLQCVGTTKNTCTEKQIGGVGHA